MGSSIQSDNLPEKTVSEIVASPDQARGQSFIHHAEDGGGDAGAAGEGVVTTKSTGEGVVTAKSTGEGVVDRSGAGAAAAPAPAAGSAAAPAPAAGSAAASKAVLTVITVFTDGTTDARPNAGS